MSDMQTPQIPQPLAELPDCFRCHEPVKLHCAPGGNPKRYFVKCTNKRCATQTKYRFESPEIAGAVWAKIVEREVRK